jgi:hypothetical protein
MRLTVHYVAQIKSVAGLAAEHLDLDRPTQTRDVLARLVESHGPLRQLLLTPEGSVQPTILLFLGDEQIGPDRPIPSRDGDVLTILSPMAGG